MPQRLTRRSFAALVLHACVFGLIYWFVFSLRTEFVQGFKSLPVRFDAR